MEIILVTLLTFFAAVGLAEFIQWLTNVIIGNKTKLYTVLPVSGHCEYIEQIIRDAYRKTKGKSQLVILDMGADNETLEIIEKFCEEYSSLKITRPREILRHIV